MTITRHLAFAILVSYGFSVAFWLFMGVFILKGFIIISAACALAGALVGYFSGKKLMTTLIATAIIRLAAFYAVMEGWVHL